MNKRILFLSLVLITSVVSAQSPKQYLAYLIDKGPEVTEYINHPEHFLSPRSVAKKKLRSIPITSKDVPVSSTYIQQLEEGDVNIVGRSRWLNAVHISTPLTAAQLKADFDFIASIEAITVTQTAYSASATALGPLNKKPVDHEMAQEQFDQIKLPCLQDQGYDGTGVVVAILGAGFQGLNTSASFDHLFADSRVIADRNFVDPSKNAYTSTNFQGIWEASVMAAKYTGEYVGGAVNASYIFATTEDLNSETHQEELNWQAAAEWADSLGADVIFSPLAYKFFDIGQGNYPDEDLDGRTAIVTKAAQAAARAGILVVVPSGGNGLNQSPTSNRISAPCDGDSVLCVGGVDTLGMRFSTSSFGPTGDGRIKPDVVALAQNVYGTHRPASVFQLSGDGYSSAMVACIATSLRQAEPQASVVEIMDAIKQSAANYHNPNNEIGHGIPDACRALQVLRGTVGLKKLSNTKEPSFKLYPTRASQEIILESVKTGKDIEPYQVKVHAISGALVYNGGITTDAIKHIDVTAWHSGLYIVQLITKSSVSNLRFIKE